jgi:hypothetical protein
LNAKEVKYAWENDLPIVIRKPNEAPVHCEKIIEVIYWKQNCRKRVSCVCVDSRGNRYRARQIDVHLSGCTNLPETKLFKRKEPSNDLYDKIVGLWIKNCPTLPKPKILTDTRRKLINKAIENDIDFEELFKKVGNSEFLTKEWNRCNFDWCLKPSNYVKIIEGNYDNKEDAEHKSTASYDIDELEKIK